MFDDFFMKEGRWVFWDKGTGVVGIGERIEVDRIGDGSS